MVLPAVGFVILYNTPKFFDHQTITSNGTCVKVKTSMGDNPFYQLIYRSLLNYLLCYFAPLILIMTLSILIFKKLLSVRNQWPSNAINSKQDLSLAVVGLIIAVIYIICQSVFLSYWLAIDFFEAKHSWLGSLASLTTTLNSSANFYVYTWKYWCKVPSRCCKLKKASTTNEHSFHICTHGRAIELSGT